MARSLTIQYRVEGVVSDQETRLFYGVTSFSNAEIAEPYDKHEVGFVLLGSHEELASYRAFLNDHWSQYHGVVRPIFQMIVPGELHGLVFEPGFSNSSTMAVWSTREHQFWRYNSFSVFPGSNPITLCTGTTDAFKLFFGDLWNGLAYHHANRYYSGRLDQDWDRNGVVVSQTGGFYRAAILCTKRASEAEWVARVLEDMKCYRRIVNDALKMFPPSPTSVPSPELDTFNLFFDFFEPLLVDHEKILKFSYFVSKGPLLATDHDQLSLTDLFYALHKAFYSRYAASIQKAQSSAAGEPMAGFHLRVPRPDILFSQPVVCWKRKDYPLYGVLRHNGDYNMDEYEIAGGTGLCTFVRHATQHVKDDLKCTSLQSWLFVREFIPSAFCRLFFHLVTTCHDRTFTRLPFLTVMKKRCG